MTAPDEPQDAPRVVVWDIIEIAEPIDDRRPWARQREHLFALPLLTPTPNLHRL